MIKKTNNIGIFISSISHFSFELTPELDLKYIINSKKESGLFLPSVACMTVDEWIICVIHTFFFFFRISFLFWIVTCVFCFYYVNQCKHWVKRNEEAKKRKQKIIVKSKSRSQSNRVMCNSLKRRTIKKFKTNFGGQLIDTIITWATIIAYERYTILRINSFVEVNVINNTLWFAFFHRLDYFWISIVRFFSFGISKVFLLYRLPLFY